jgi:hypothetical protein
VWVSWLLFSSNRPFSSNHFSSDFEKVKQAIKALQREVGSQFALEHETQGLKPKS